MDIVGGLLRGAGWFVVFWVGYNVAFNMLVWGAVRLGWWAPTESWGSVLLFFSKLPATFAGLAGFLALGFWMAARRKRG